jgi:5S rRNA maturation endonuclease (ribonuclease M5)
MYLFYSRSVIKSYNKGQKYMKRKYPNFWVYTNLSDLERLLPSGYTFELVAAKEILDNALDAAEAHGGSVDISLCLKSKTLEVINTGVLTYEDIKNITDFSLFYTEKFKKRGFIRGQIGHGLKIAIMMVISEENPVRIKSIGGEFILRLKNRNSHNPNEVIEIEECPHNSYRDNLTKISIHLKETDGIEKLIRSYIALNPHIMFNLKITKVDKKRKRKKETHKFKPATELKKSNKLDIFSYSLDDFRLFSEPYLRHISIEEFIELFNVPRYKLKRIVKTVKSDDIEGLYKAIKNSVKTLSVPVFGDSAFFRRLLDLGKIRSEYKKIKTENGMAEVIVLTDRDDLFDSIAGVNGSCLSSRAFWINSEHRGKYLNSPFTTALRDVKADRAVLLSYYSPKINFTDYNKQEVRVEGLEIYNKLKKIFKKNTKSSNSWLLKEYDGDGSDNRFSFSNTIYQFLCQVHDIAIHMVGKHGPITLRQLYYRLVVHEIITNTHNSYKNFINHLGSAREQGMIAYDLFEDRSRYTLFPKAVSLKENVRDYILRAIKDALKVPRLDIWENQPEYVEVWIEKDALTNVVAGIANKKQVPLFPSRGYTSLTKIEEARRRIYDKQRMGKHCVILYFGDLDPSGFDIYRNITRKFMDIQQLEIKRVALNPEHVSELIPIPLKDTDTRTERFKQFILYHNIPGAYELDALDPDELVRLVEQSIDIYFDHSLVDKKRMIKWQREFQNAKNRILSKIGLDSFFQN